MDDFLKKFFPAVFEKKHHALENNYCKYDNQFLQLFTSCLYLAALIASFVASKVCSKYGRKLTMQIASIFFIIGVILTAGGINIEMIIFGRIFLGFGVGFANQAVPLFLSEIAPPNLRGALNISFQLFITIGILVSNLINYSTTNVHPHGWRISLGIAGVPALMLCLGSILICETPTSLIERHKVEEGRKVLRKIRGVENVDDEFDSIIHACEMAKQVKDPFRKLMKPVSRPQLVISICLQIFQQFTGINAIMFYAPVLFQTVGFGNDAAHNKLVVENRIAFEDTVSRLAGAGRFDHIEHLLEHQKTLPQGRREGFIMRIIMLYGKAGMVQHAIDTFRDMHLYGCKRTVKSLNATLKVLSQTRDLRAIEAFLAEVPQDLFVELDAYTVNIVVKAFCGMDFLDSAFLYMVQMERLGIKPDVITYTTLISASYQKNRCEIGNGLWNLMVYKGCKPNLTTFNVRVQYLINRRLAWKANDVMRLMKKIGIEPDEVTYNLVIKGFCQAGYLEMAKRVYSSLEFHSTYKPNAKIYQTMIHYLCKGGEYNLAYTRCIDCMRKNWFPSVDTIHSLVQGLTRNGQLKKAKRIMRLVRNHRPPFSSSQFDSLQSICRRSDGLKPNQFD